jgi:flagellar basal-body rod protein FlgB
MIDALFSQPDYIAAKKMLDATVLRHEAIASNLANLETPNYQRIDVAPSFTNELREAIASGNAEKVNNLQPRLEIDANAVATNRDGNTVQLETELMNLQQNFLQHGMETRLITYNLLRLRSAILGQPQ